MTKIAIKINDFEQRVSVARGAATDLGQKDLKLQHFSKTNAAPFVQMLTVSNKMDSLIKKYQGVVANDVAQFQKTQAQLVKQDQKLAQDLGGH